MPLFTDGLAPRLLPKAERWGAATLPVVSSVRARFPFCVCTSSTADRFLVSGSVTLLGGGASSSSDNVKSMTVLFCESGGYDPPTEELDAGPLRNSERFTWRSSSESESSIRTSTSGPGGTEDLSLLVPLPDAKLVDTGDRLGAPAGAADGAGVGGATGCAGCESFQAGEAYSLSTVCHSPSASTITSSVSSCVPFRISSKYLFAV